MKINVSKYQGDSRRQVEILAKNGLVMFHAAQSYASRRNALAAANLLAKSKLKVVVEE
jgi:hypothetical protein